MLGKDEKVCVSGYGVVTPYGIGVDKSFFALLEGKQIYSDNHDLDLSNEYYTQRKIAAIPCVLLQDQFPDVHCCAIATKLTLLALNEALEKAYISVEDLRCKTDNIGIAITTLESEALEKIAMLQEAGKGAEDFFAIAHPEYCVQQIRKYTCATGPSMVLSNACASGNHAIAAGYDMIKSGEVDIAIVGGGCKVFRSAVAGFHQFRGISADTCRPFDLTRSGTMLGDGAAILILENLRHAENRGVKTKIIVSGYGSSCDAHDMIMQHPEGRGMLLSMQRALKMAGLLPTDIQYINAHGTGTIQNDRLETLSINKLFEGHAKKISISSTKALFGHNLYAASATEAVWCCCVLDTGIIPGTWNARERDKECDLDYVFNRSLSKDVKNCINNSFGFGGSNSSVIFSKLN